MKQLMLVALGIGALSTLGFYVNRTKAPIVSTIETAPQPVSHQVVRPRLEERARATPPEFSEATSNRNAPANGRASDATNPARPAPILAPSIASIDPGFDQALTMVLSQDTSFEQKQTMWKQWRKAGKLDEAISQLEQRATSNPQSAEPAVELGQAYWQKCAAIDDIREQAFLVMRADQAFDAALNLDPANWEARYTKALAMSHWPLELNKGNDVIQQFQTLIQQQEVQTPQPEFALSYLRFGEFYRKAGYPDTAAQLWQRGAALFPNSTELQKKLAEASAAH
jgi:tetratricopeptide (TPR) repeat protein